MESKDLTTLTLDELMGNLKTYELRRKVKNLGEPIKTEPNLALTAADKYFYDKESVFIAKSVQKYLNKKTGASGRGRSSNMKHVGECFKYGSIDHYITKCPVMEEEWRKKYVDQRRKAREQVHKKGGTSKAMMAGFQDSEDEKSDDDLALMALEDSESEEDVELFVSKLKREVKNMLRKKLVKVFHTVLNKLGSIRDSKDQLHDEIDSLGNELKKAVIKNDTLKRTNCMLKEQVFTLESTVQKLQSEIVEARTNEKGKGIANSHQLIAEENLKDTVDELLKKNEKIRSLKEDSVKTKK